MVKSLSQHLFEWNNWQFLPSRREGRNWVLTVLQESMVVLLVAIVMLSNISSSFMRLEWTKNSNHCVRFELPPEEPCCFQLSRKKDDEIRQATDHIWNQYITGQHEFKVSCWMYATGEQRCRPSPRSSTDSDLLPIAPKHVVQRIQTESRSEVSLDKL